MFTIAGIQRRRQPIPHVVVHCECFFGVGNLDDGQHRSENFFLLQARSRRDVAENGRLKKPAGVQIAAIRFAGCCLTATSQVRPLLLPYRDITRRFFRAQTCVDHRTNVRSLGDGHHPDAMRVRAQ